MSKPHFHRSLSLGCDILKKYHDRLLKEVKDHLEAIAGKLSESKVDNRVKVVSLSKTSNKANELLKEVELSSQMDGEFFFRFVNILRLVGTSHACAELCSLVSELEGEVWSTKEIASVVQPESKSEPCEESSVVSENYFQMPTDIMSSPHDNLLNSQATTVHLETVDTCIRPFLGVESSESQLLAGHVLPESAQNLSDCGQPTQVRTCTCTL